MADFSLWQGRPVWMWTLDVGQLETALVMQERSAEPQRPLPAGESSEAVQISLRCDYQIFKLQHGNGKGGNKIGAATVGN